MLVLAGFVMYTMFFGQTSKDLMMQDDLAQNFSGRVDSIYFDERNHNGKYAVLSNEQICPIIRPWERHIEIGDSLSKKKGSFILEVYRKNKKKLTLDYRDIYKK